MCGIGGIIHFDGARLGVSENLLAMANAQKHRGPDGEGYVLFNPLDGKPAYGSDTPEELKKLEGFVSISKINDRFTGGFCHRRLSIIDLTIGGHQPITNEHGNVWLTFNGEIYNYKELKKQLSAKGYQFYSESDAEVLIACWKAFGTRMPEYLDGMWALAIVDFEKQLFFASRDRIGVKPLYYHFSNKTLFFASEVKALQAAGLSLKPNKVEVSNFLLFGSTPTAPSTFFDTVYLLEPGHNLVSKLSEATIQKQAFYKPSFTSELGHFSPEKSFEYSAETKSLIVAGVKSRLTSDVPVGVCLSGGLDSSAILGSVYHLLKKESIPMIGEKPKAFTVVFPDQNEDESELAATMVNLTGANHFTVSPTAEGFFQQIEDLAYTMEMPFKGTNSYSAFKLFELISKANIKVTLDGQGADELFGGYSRFGSVFIRQLMLNRRPFALWKELNETALKKGQPHMWWLEIVKHLALQKMSFHWNKPNLKFLNNETKETALKYNKEPLFWNLNQALQESMPGHELAYMLLASDKLSMRFGVESRVPFCDYLPLIEKAGFIPSIYKWRKGRNKYLMYEATKDLVSNEIYKNKQKKGFSTPFGSWLKETHNLWPTYFSNDMNEWIDVVGLKKNWPNLKKTVEKNPEVYWRMISVSLWKKAFKM